MCIIKNMYFKVCIILLVFGLSAAQNEGETINELVDTTTEKAGMINELAETETNEVSDVICQICNCTAGYVDCMNSDIHQPFELQDWEGLQNLSPTTIDLSQNHMTSFCRISALPVKTLNLSHCEIATIEDASFIRLTDLVSLDLSNNKLSTNDISGRIFIGPKIQNIPPAPFKKFTYLSLAQNDIHSLPADLFNFMSEMKTLDLSGNPLAFIDQVTMAAITVLIKLRELRLSGCELETLPEGLFRRLTRLSKLDLSDNRFSTVPTTLSEAANLAYLNFGKNPIQTLEANNAILNLTKLQELRLCRNSKLQSIGAGALAGLENLVTLRICYNPRLTSIDPDFLVWKDDHEVENWPLLTELYLNNNNISEIDAGILERWNQLTVVDVTNNPYVCDCRNQWMVDVLVPLVSEIGTNDSARNMICKKPQELRGLSFAQLYNSSKALVCLESENLTELPMPDMAILLGIMIGIFVTFPLVLVVVLVWKKGYFARCRSTKMDASEDEEESDAF